jgi:arsenate reductase
MTVTIYGITNCTTMQKARAWLDEHGIPYGFHDYRKAGAPVPLLEGWAAKLGWEKLLNRSGLTWRRVPEADKAELDAPRALALMHAKPT